MVSCLLLQGVLTVIDVMRGDCKCARCVYATVVSYAADDAPMRVYCPYAGCIRDKKDVIGGGDGNGC